MSESTEEDYEALRRLSLAAKASRRRHVDDCAARDARIYQLVDIRGERINRVAAVAEMAPSHIVKVVADQAAARQQAAAA